MLKLFWAKNVIVTTPKFSEIEIRALSSQLNFSKVFFNSKIGFSKMDILKMSKSRNPILEFEKKRTFLLLT